MPNNHVSSYCIPSEFFFFLKDLPGLIIKRTESVGFINVEINQLRERRSFFGANSYFLYNSRYYLIDQLLKELEKVQLEARELIDIGSALKKYWLVLNRISSYYAYSSLTLGIMIVFFISLHFSQLFFPENELLDYASLIADFYSIGFGLFSIWSLNKYERVLRVLENYLIRKIDFLRSFSFSLPQMVDVYPGSSESMLPSYEEVLAEDTMQNMNRPTILIAPENVSSFFYAHRCNECCDSNDNETDLSRERAYSV